MTWATVETVGGALSATLAGTVLKRQDGADGLQRQLEPRAEPHVGGHGGEGVVVAPGVHAAEHLVVS